MNNNNNFVYDISRAIYNNRNLELTDQQLVDLFSKHRELQRRTNSLFDGIKLISEDIHASQVNILQQDSSENILVRARALDQRARTGIDTLNIVSRGLLEENSLLCTYVLRNEKISNQYRTFLRYENDPAMLNHYFGTNLPVPAPVQVPVQVPANNNFVSQNNFELFNILVISSKRLEKVKDNLLHFCIDIFINPENILMLLFNQIIFSIQSERVLFIFGKITVLKLLNNKIIKEKLGRYYYYLLNIIKVLSLILLLYKILIFILPFLT